VRTAQALGLVLGCAVAAAASAGPPFRVSKVALATVYVDAGRSDGLKVGDHLEVVTGDETVVARLEVVAVNDHVAACRARSLQRPLHKGDTVVPAGRAVGPRTASASPAPASTASSAKASAPLSSEGAKAAPPSPKGANAAPAPDGEAGPATTAAVRPLDPPAPAPAAKTGPAAGTSKPRTSPPSAASLAKPAAASNPQPPRTATVVTPAGTPPPPGFAALRTPPAPRAAAGNGSTPAPVPPAAPRTDPTPEPEPGPRALPAHTPAASLPTPPTAEPARVATNGPSGPPVVAEATTPPANPPSGEPEAAFVPGRTFRVKYRSASSVYLEGGRAQGLMVGDQLRVQDGQAPVAELQVVYVSELSASCKILSESRPVRAGDDAISLVRPATALAAATTTRPSAPRASDVARTGTPASGPVAAPAAASSAATPPWAHVRGNVSFGYYKTWDESDSGLDFEQRTGRVDLGLYDIAGQPLTFSLRGRTRQDVRARTLSVRTPQSERVDRLYELALRYEPPSDRLAFEVGRIGIYRFVGIGYLDGALGRVAVRPGIQIGAFGGRNAEIEGLGLEGTGGKYGAFVRLAPPGRYRIGGYDVLFAYVRENADGDVSREYFSLESSFNGGGRWSLFERAELDLNRGWRQEVSGKSQQLSNVSLSGNLRVGGSAWAFVSYDGRRNYRYYRNRLVPEEVFDDLLHQGLRAGINVARPGGLGASASFGMSLKESDPRHPELDVANAYSFNAGLRHSNLFSSGLSGGIDGSGFTNGYAEGGLLSAHLGISFEAGHTLDFSYGYSLYNVTATQEDRTTQWLRFMGRAELGRRFYVLGDFEYDAGDDLQGPRGFLEGGVIF
jgi:hypothetical protein